MRHIKWMLKQLLPLRYESHIHNDYFSFRMWFGRCFAYKYLS